MSVRVCNVNSIFYEAPCIRIRTQRANTRTHSITLKFAQRKVGDDANDS